MGGCHVSRTIVPAGYRSRLNLYQTQMAIGMLKHTFEERLCMALNLKRVSAPLFVDPASGLNDDLNGVERPVTFDIAETGRQAAVVHSLAKWKRMALHTYGFAIGEGLYTDMNAIRRDEHLDNLHSVYTDQWDWEKVISQSDRNLDYLMDTVRREVVAICGTLDALRWTFPQLDGLELERNVTFVTAQELEDRWPTLTPKEREDRLLREVKTAFIMQIGDVMRSGERHDGRAPDYDDWSLNGDLLFYNELLDCAFEVSSMGIRVDAKSLKSQLEKAGAEERAELPFHKMLLRGQLPQSIGGGIGQSRLSMLLLGKAHIGEVQVSLWDDETVKTCADAGIVLL